jgi:protein-S-isoprenylcysteine O-methyltransferase Ste14
MIVWLAKALVIVGLAGMIVVRAPHIRRSTALKVVKTRRTTLDNVLVGLVGGGLFLPLVWVVSSALAFADYRFSSAQLVTGGFCLVLGLWLLHRSHVDLGTNWSNTLELREQHQLVKGGVYRQVRHPMYSAILLYALGQALVVPNFVAGPLLLLVFALLVASRLRAEEQMMLEEFGASYEAYMAETKRLIPGVW